MSYELVKTVKIDQRQNVVEIKSSSNNVFPKDYHYWKCTSLSNTLQEKGKLATEIKILELYLSGEFQAGIKNKYTRATSFLWNLPEYEKFDWRQTDDSEKTKKENPKEYERLLLLALAQKPEKKDYVISLGTKSYLKYRRGSRTIRYTSKGAATRFTLKEANDLAQRIVGVQRTVETI